MWSSRDVQVGSRLRHIVRAPGCETAQAIIESFLSLRLAFHIIRYTSKLEQKSWAKSHRPVALNLKLMRKDVHVDRGHVPWDRRLEP